MVNEMSDEELLKAVRRIESPPFELEFRTVALCDIFTKCCKIIEHPRKKKNKGGKKHKCCVTQCLICQEDVDIRTHKYFIQPAEEEERPRRSKEERNARIKRLQLQGIPMSAMDPDEIDFKDPPIFVYTDYEAMQSADGEHRLIMVCCETNQEDHTHAFWVEHTLREEEGDSGLTARTEDRVTHAGNRGEHAIVTPTRVCYVDDFHPVTQTVYEFHGCVWHGCPRYHPNCRLVPRVHQDRSMEEVYDAACAKTALLRSMGFTVVEMWECFWDDLSKHDPRLIQFPHTLEIVEPLDPRHAFYGGRTGATCLYHKTD